jgi:DNA polymerase III sliding clamp (beta) subunit (PCNA family)
LPAKKLGEIISRLNDEIIKFELNGATVTITSKKSKFDIIGISANEFPQVEENISETDCMEIETEPFTKAIREVVSAAAGYETNNLLSGVVCQVNKNILEMAATDGNRLARVREVVKNSSTDEENPFEMLISSRILAELSKIADKAKELLKDKLIDETVMKAIQETTTREQNKLSMIDNKQFNSLVKILRRNPTATSTKNREALEEIKHLMDK